MLPVQVESMVRAQAENPYWHEEDARLVVAAWADSGLTMAGFARHYGFNVKRLHRWRRRLEDDESVTGPSFHEVRVVDPIATIFEDTATQEAMFEVVVRGERRVRLGPTFDERALAKVIRVLESVPC